jgi:hypothetical protein
VRSSLSRTPSLDPCSPYNDVVVDGCVLNSQTRPYGCPLSKAQYFRSNFV